ncbi:MAG TPA: sigma-70 family RNA polymerase sigma factor, partial [Ilumatobacteraceae bacterium]|nr:sigma-70 family RNA polymerase sigma factor [Ilumatobacteraceae bacterium]
AVARDTKNDAAIEMELEVEASSTSPVTFTELYLREFQLLVRLATLMTGRVEVARDIVQDAFVKLHVKWPGVRDPAAYVRRSVVNGCRSHHRWERRRRGRPTAAEPSVDLAVDHTLAALERLPHKQRAALVMKFYEGRTESEIADALGCRPGSVGPMVQRALERMRVTLS